MSHKLQRVLYNLASLADLGHEVASKKNFTIASTCPSVKAGKTVSPL
ncbi:MAG: hypothetical protein FD164_1395 [Nitrospirae bacterium]|nr:MAG: hypothetical protein FD164_1395 [Nitrospirota bacterium]